jgi:hypothetical protein
VEAGQESIGGIEGRAPDYAAADHHHGHSRLHTNGFYDDLSVLAVNEVGRVPEVE